MAFHLDLRPALSRPDLLTKPVAAALGDYDEEAAGQVEAAEIDPLLAILPGAEVIDGLGVPLAPQ